MTFFHELIQNFHHCFFRRAALQERVQYLFSSLLHDAVVRYLRNTEETWESQVRDRLSYYFDEYTSVLHHYIEHHYDT